MRLGWITERQLLDAAAAGQLTPGPLFTSATFISYLLGGLPGAMLVTLGIFLPAFIFVLFTQPLLTRLRSMQGAAGLLAGVNAASLGQLAAVAGQLAWGLAGDPVGALLLVRTRLPARQLAVAGRRAAGCAARRIVVGCCAGAGSAQSASIWPRHHELTRGECPNSQTKSRG